MDIQSRVSGSLAALQRGAFERGYKQGVDDTIAAIAKTAEANDVAKAKVKPARKRAARQQRPKTTKRQPKTAVVKGVAAKLMEDGDEVGFDRIFEASISADGRVTRHDVGNAMNAMRKAGDVRRVGDGVYARPAGNGADQPA